MDVPHPANTRQNGAVSGDFQGVYQGESAYSAAQVLGLWWA